MRLRTRQRWAGPSTATARRVESIEIESSPASSASGARSRVRPAMRRESPRPSPRSASRPEPSSVATLDRRISVSSASLPGVGTKARWSCWTRTSPIPPAPETVPPTLEDTGAVGHGLEPELGLHSAVRPAVSRPAREMLHPQGAVGPDPGLLAQGSGEPCHDLGILTLGAQLSRQHPALDAQVGPATREPGLVDGGGQQVQDGSCPQTVSGAGSDRGREPRVDRGCEIGAVQPRAQIEGFDAAAADLILGRIRHGRAVARRPPASRHWCGARDRRSELRLRACPGASRR